ncbi:TetR/AcrR family transcriptional regulator [Vallitalea maricola]|uniref:TetR/AcrR family transcriptional regulator n=1 Tax=Vallitalea maricola TaxID=3074433 RepID=A0ACB5UK24_9FIRM|nr:TetR/AcrR family transcriptional regulator [Vallitalea sp. AN17-2]
MRKDDIVQVALEAFCHNDYDHVSINMIIKESKTSKGVFYHYFKNKEQLYFYIVDLILDEKIKFFNDREKLQKQPKADSIFSLLRQQIDKSLDFSLAYPKFALFCIQARKGTNESIKKKVYKKMEYTTNEYYVNLIKNNIEKGIIRKDFPEEFVVSIVTYMLPIFLDYVHSQGIEICSKNNHIIKEYYLHYIDFMENGLSN